MQVPFLEWQNVESNSPNPGARSRHGFVYDQFAKVGILFGGIDFQSDSLRSDTWELECGNWSQVQTSIEPPGRHRGAMVFDSKRGFCVLFGGQAFSKQSWMSLNDTWIYENRNWMKKRFSWFRRCPEERCGHAMAFDEDLGLTILFGGVDLMGFPLGDTWTFNGVRWNRIDGPAPSPRRYAAFAYHPELKGCVLHGGAVDDDGEFKFGDTWLFRGLRWETLGQQFNTVPRDDHAMAFHHAAKTMVMLDGLIRDDQRQPIREVRQLTTAGWQQVEIAIPYPRHQCAPLAYDGQADGLVFYGAETGHGGSQFDQTYILRAIQ